MADNLNDRLNDLIKLQNKINDIVEKLESGAKDYLEVQLDILKISKERAKLLKNIDSINENIKKLLKEEETLKSKIRQHDELGNKRLAEYYRKKLKLLNKEIYNQNSLNKELEKQVELAKNNLQVLDLATKKASLLRAIGKSSVNFAKKWGWDKLKEYGIFDIDKEIRNTARSLGVSGNNYKSFALNFKSAADSTNLIGVNIKRLINLQRGYTEEIGRSVILTEENLNNIARISEGVGLGDDFTQDVMTTMDDFGSSVKSAIDLLQANRDNSLKYGVSVAAASKVFLKNLKLAQKYNFKDGVKGISKISNEVTRLKINMESIAGLADGLFNPEGAIELAARLNVLGGEFSKLGDPMSLMFKARNEIDQLAKDIAKASAEFVEFNEETKTFELRGGLAAHRMREIAKLTNLTTEELFKMAVQQKKIQQIGEITPINIPDEDKEFLASIAQRNNKNEWVVNIKGHEKLIKDLSNTDIEVLKNRKESLEKIAENAQTFDETIENFKNTLKQQLLPLAISLKDGLGEPLIKLGKLLSKEGYLDKITNFVRNVGDVIVNVTDFIIKNPIKSGLMTLAGSLLFEYTKWYKIGQIIRSGFEGKGFFNGIGNTLGFGNKTKKQKTSNLNKTKPRKGTPKKGFGVKGIGSLALGAIATDMGKSLVDDENSDLYKGLDIASTTLEYGSYGAMIGSLIPIPGATLVGGIAGGLVGLGSGVYSNYFDNDNKNKYESNVSIDDGIIKLNPKDKITRVDDLILASTSEGNLTKSVDKITNKTNKILHEFSKLEIIVKFEGIIDDIARKIIDEPELRRSINNAILGEISKASSGGKLTPNPNF